MFLTRASAQRRSAVRATEHRTASPLVFDAVPRLPIIDHGDVIDALEVSVSGHKVSTRLTCDTCDERVHRSDWSASVLQLGVDEGRIRLAKSIYE